MEGTKVSTDLENKSLVIERTFDASQDTLWAAFSQKEQFEQWWGPEGWETIVKEFDFVSGGTVHYCMKCVDKEQGEWYGQESWGVIKLEEVNAPRDFTYVDYFSDETGTLNEEMPALTITNKLIELEGKTTFISRSVAATAADIEQLLEMGMVEGFSSSTDKLAKLVVTSD